MGKGEDGRFYEEFRDSPWVARGSDPGTRDKVMEEFGPKMKKAEKAVSNPTFLGNLRLLFAYLLKGPDLAPKALIVAALLYFISPLDLVPDFIPAAGYLDDIAVVAGVMSALADTIRRFREEREGIARPGDGTPPKEGEGP